MWIGFDAFSFLGGRLGVGRDWLSSPCVANDQRFLHHMPEFVSDRYQTIPGSVSTQIYARGDSRLPAPWQWFPALLLSSHLASPPAVSDPALRPQWPE